MTYTVDFFSSVNKTPEQSANSGISLKAISELTAISQDKERWNELSSWVSELDIDDICACEKEDTAVAFLIQGLFLDKLKFQPVSDKEVLRVGIRSIEYYQKAIGLFDDENPSLKLLTEYLLKEKINSRASYRDYMQSLEHDENIELATNNSIKCS